MFKFMAQDLQYVSKLFNATFVLFPFCKYPLLCLFSDGCNLDLKPTRVSAFREILQSLQCKIVQYTFLGQNPIKLQDFFSQCKIPHPAWLQLDHKKLGPSWMRLFRPLYYKTEKTLFQMWYAALKNINQGVYWVFNFQDIFDNKYFYLQTPKTFLEVETSHLKERFLSFIIQGSEKSHS